jgi:hypothetical protein
LTARKPNTKQELIAANIKLLIEQLEAGHSDALTNYLTAMSRFHNYSFGNVLGIARQVLYLADVNKTCGFSHRRIRAMEHSIRPSEPLTKSILNKSVTIQWTVQFEKAGYLNYTTHLEEVLWLPAILSKPHFSAFSRHLLARRDLSDVTVHQLCLCDSPAGFRCKDLNPHPIIQR